MGVAGGEAPRKFLEKSLTKFNLCIDIIKGKKFVYVNTFLYLCIVKDRDFHQT